MLGLLPRIKLHHITQVGLCLRLYEILLERILSFGVHDWGLLVCSYWLSSLFLSLPLSLVSFEDYQLHGHVMFTCRQRGAPFST
jgi:hypothetical protein